MTNTIDCAVIGAGVIGLAVARALALGGQDVILLEKEDAIGTGASSRNSEVIHAGIYYPEGSLKARLCVKGRKMLYDYCAGHGIDHRNCGKLIVATDESQFAFLENLRTSADANGVGDLEWLDGGEAMALEPRLRCVAALLSPSTGIFDSHAYMLSIQADAEAHGAMIAFKSPVMGGSADGKEIVLEVGGTEPMELACRYVVNCASLDAQAMANSIRGMPPEAVPKRYLAKGNYFYLSSRPPFSRLIYPVPTTASLGVHYTLDLGGQGRFGPDVEWVDQIDYSVDPGRAPAFYEAISRYWPDIEEGALNPGYAGIRPKIQAPGEPTADFIIQGEKTHGIKGLINLFGIESPGLTASLAIAEEVAEIV